MRDLKRIKDSVDIVSLIGSTVRLSKGGSAYVGLCPFHDDHNPSLVVWPDGGFKCMGCGIRGDVVKWVMLTEKRGFKDAVDRLAKGEFPAKTLPSKKKKGLVIDFSIAHPRAIKYFTHRGLITETIHKFKLGYNGWRFAIPTYSEGKLVHVSYRKDPHNNFDRNEKRYYCQEGSILSIFNEDALDNYDTIYIVEGQIDTMIYDQEGYGAICTTSGVASFRREWYDRLRDKDIIIATDTDEPGITNGYALGERLERHGIPRSVKITNMSVKRQLGVKDVGEYSIHERRES